MNKIIGEIVKISGSNIQIYVENEKLIEKANILSQSISYLSIGSLLGTKLFDQRTLVLIVNEIIDNGHIFINCSISGVYDETNDAFKFGTYSYPLIHEKVFLLDFEVLNVIFNQNKSNYYIGSYAYNENVKVSFDPNILFGKHLGVFGNTGSGKTCTIASLIQRYIRDNPSKDIKFIILDVNGEYKNAFKEDECCFIQFSDLRIRHNILSLPEYGRLFRTSEGVQYPALKSAIEKLKNDNKKWDLCKLSQELENWVSNYSSTAKRDAYLYNNLSGYLRTLFLRVEQICSNDQLTAAINSDDGKEIMDIIKDEDKKVFIIDLQVSTDTLDIILFLLFKSLYINKTLNKNKISSHLNLILEEAHRYINVNVDETKLGNYYIDKLAREGRKFGIGLIISSQIPSMLNYEIISQCNSVIMHKITNYRDLEYLKNVLRISNNLFFLQMSALEKQYAIVTGEAFTNDCLVKINTAEPLPKSNDPIIKEKS